VSRTARIGTVLLAAAAPASSASREQATIDRPEDPIEMVGGDVAQLIDTAVDGFALYVWVDDQFQPLNFQVDERGPGGGYFSEEAETGFIDDNDQIVFMVEDGGDRAGTGEWLDHANVEPDHRYEIELEDPLNPGAKGWVYLFLGADLPRSSADYVDVLADDPFHVASDRYGEEYLPGIPGALDDLTILPAIGGSGTDLYDRMKFRLKLGPLWDWQTEEDGVAENTNYKDGSVRVILAYNVTIPILEFALSNTQVIYHRQMSITRNKIFQLYWPEAKRMLWLTDLNPQIDDFVYYDNRGGDKESPATFTDLVDGDGMRDEDESFSFQEIVSPTHGASISVQDNDPIPADETLAYYCDQCGEEAWPETGDGEKWGESGTWLKRIEFQNEPFELESWNWRTGPYDDGSRGHHFASRYYHRTQITARWQAPTAIEDQAPPAPAGAGLSLAQNVPNPFNPRTKISFVVPENAGGVRLEVFDVAGRKVRVLVREPLPAGAHSVVWDGRGDDGRTLPSGIYSCRIATAERSAARRMLLLK